MRRHGLPAWRTCMRWCWLPPTSSRPPLVSLAALTGAQFKDTAAGMSSGCKEHCRVTACMRLLPLKYGPLYYVACSNSVVSGRSICQNRVNDEGRCPKCDSVVEAVPFLSLSRASFQATDGSTVRFSALGAVAERLLGIGAIEAKAMEATCIREGDVSRDSQKQRLTSALNKFFDLAVTVESVTLEDGSAFISATVYDVAMPSNSPPASASCSGSAPAAKRARDE